MTDNRPLAAIIKTVQVSVDLPGILPAQSEYYATMIRTHLTRLATSIDIRNLASIDVAFNFSGRTWEFLDSWVNSDGYAALSAYDPERAGTSACAILLDYGKMSPLFGPRSYKVSACLQTLARSVAFASRAVQCDTLGEGRFYLTAKSTWDVIARDCWLEFITCHDTAGIGDDPLGSFFQIAEGTLTECLGILEENAAEEEIDEHELGLLFSTYRQLFLSASSLLGIVSARRLEIKSLALSAALTDLLERLGDILGGIQVNWLIGAQQATDYLKLSDFVRLYTYNQPTAEYRGIVDLLEPVLGPEHLYPSMACRLP